MRLSKVMAGVLFFYSLITAAAATPTSLLFGNPHNYILAPRDDTPPDCDNTKNTYSGSYSDGEGTYVTSDRVTHPYKFPLIRKCWYDYYVVSASAEFLPWRKSSGDIYCSGTSSCSVSELNGTQVCQSVTTGISANVGAAIEGITLGVGVSISTDNQHCATASQTEACTWSDEQCHCVWTQQQVLKQVGYLRHRCNYAAKGQHGKGDHTWCMKDWEMTTPTTLTNYGCGSKCTDTNV
jgi:hypothetical protein